MSEPLRIDILGAGSVGLALAGRLAVTPDVSVRLRTRSREQAERLNRDGFVLHDEQGSHGVRVEAVAGDAADKPPAAPNAPEQSASGGAGLHARPNPPNTPDILLVAVKCPDTAAAARQHAGAIVPETLVVTIQNGLGADRLLREVFGDRVAVAVTRMGAHRTDDGVRLVSSGRMWVGPAVSEDAETRRPGDAQTRAGREARPTTTDGRGTRDRFIAALSAAGFPAEAVDPIEPYVWRKLLVNAAINAPATLRDCRNGELLSDPDSLSVMRDVLFEGLAVAAAAGVEPFPDLAAAEAEVHATAQATAANVCSMLADRRAGRPTEIDFINGALVRAGDEHRVPVPVNRNLVRLVKGLRAKD